MTTTVLAVSVDPALAKKLSRTAKRVRDSTAERDRLISEAIHAGGSLREVAELVELSHTAISKIVRRHDG